MNELWKVFTGAGSPLEWMASGREPVSHELAGKRAEVCTRCPKNGRSALSHYFTEPAARIIQAAIEVRHDFKMTTQYDARLGVCEACGCPLKLKVFEPLDIALKHTSAETRKELWEKCWLLQEENS